MWVHTADATDRAYETLPTAPDGASIPLRHHLAGLGPRDAALRGRRLIISYTTHMLHIVKFRSFL